MSAEQAYIDDVKLDLNSHSMIVGGHAREDAAVQSHNSPFRDTFARNAARSSRTLQEAEREWLTRFQSERDRHRSKELEQRKQIGKLNTTVQQFKNKETNDLQKQIQIKRSYQELRKKLSELVVQNSQLKKQIEKNEYRIAIQLTQ